jgi:hypothetical protein
VQRGAAADRAATLQALRRPDGVAGRALPRVRGTPARLRDCPSGGRLRRGGAAARPRLEGARPPAARRRGCAARGGASAAARGGSPHVRPVRSRPASRTGDTTRRSAASRSSWPRCGSFRACRSSSERAAVASAGSSATERRTVRGAFRASRSAPRAVALIDDVYTTGATAAAGASALRAGGARRVEAIAFARALRRGSR